MSKYFIKPIDDLLYGKIESKIYQLNDSADTTIMINVIPPGVVVPTHQHDEHQIGMCLSGKYKIIVDDNEYQMNALEHCYWAPSGCRHGGENVSAETVVTLDIKRKPQPQDVKLTQSPLDKFFLSLTNSKKIKGGLAFSFFVGPWFEIMYSLIEPGAVMPRHDHRGIQIGIGLTGSYLMEVNGEELQFTKYCVYYAPEHIPHSAFNSSNTVASSLNIFIPPRWNLLPVKEREIAL